MGYNVMVCLALVLLYAGRCRELHIVTCSHTR
jgi:hypothetical protein